MLAYGGVFAYSNFIVVQIQLVFVVIIVFCLAMTVPGALEHMMVCCAGRAPAMGVALAKNT